MGSKHSLVVARSQQSLSPRRKWVGLAVIAGLFAAVPILHSLRGEIKAAPDLRLHRRPLELPNLRFADGNGAATALSSFLGRVVLLNVWATWCPPCRDEMASLDRLQAALGGPGFEVVALSIDQGGLPAVHAFFDRMRLQHLRPYIDSFSDAAESLASAGVPLTLLVDREGREVGRKLGPAAWDHPATAELIRGRVEPIGKGP